MSSCSSVEGSAANGLQLITGINNDQSRNATHGPLARYVKLWVAHAPGMPCVSDPDIHHGTCVTHVSWCMSGSVTSCFLWSRWQWKRSRYSRRMRNPQLNVSGKRPMPSLRHNQLAYYIGFNHTIYFKQTYDIGLTYPDFILTSHRLLSFCNDILYWWLIWCGYMFLAN